MNKKNTAIEILKRVPALIIMGISIYLSGKSYVPMPDFDNSDKFVHFICFGGLAFWWTFWWNNSKWLTSPLKYFFLPLIIVSLYGVADEIHQSFTPGRSCSVFDWMADTLGSALGISIRIALSKILVKLIHPVNS